MNWNNIPKLRFKVYDPELKKFFAAEDLTSKIKSGNNPFNDEYKDRYYVCYNESGLVFGFYDAKGDWDECTIFPYSGYKDKDDNELYLYDKIAHADNDFTGVIDIVDGKWVVRYDSQRTALLADRFEYIKFTKNPDVD